MNAEIYAKKENPFSLKMNNVTKELSVRDSDGNWVTIYTNIQALKSLKELIERELKEKST